MDEIAAQIDALIGREGAYSDHPSDLGGATRWGITEQVARAYGYAGDMRALPREFAAGLYRKRYWLAPQFDQVGARYPKLAIELFDAGVNQGIKYAAEWLQRALNVLNGRGQIYADIAVDGAIGRITLLALDGYRKRRGADGEAVLVEAVRALRGARYVEICEARAANEDFAYGWFARMVELRGAGR